MSVNKVIFEQMYVKECKSITDRYKRRVIDKKGRFV